MDDGMFISSSVCGPKKIYLYGRGTKEVLDKKRTTKYDEYSIIVELPAKVSDDKPRVMSNECKWKIGNSKNRYSDLQYQNDNIPIDFEIRNKMSYYSILKHK